ncbi:MAG TPA: hypothetical protein VN926_23905 [Bradyrhizobium sp.]|jgi:hypothetical protein|nr:hypothetical protein [Bradyrhizobium sp.]
MFERLAISGLVKFWPVQPQRAAPRLRADGPFTAAYSNDNLPGFRHPKGPRRIPSPALACHWIDRNGRLECRWQAEPGGDAPLGDFDTHGTAGRASGLSSMHARSLTMAG